MSITPSEPSRWTIDRDPNGTYLLKHPTFESITDLPTFDEAHELRKAVIAGKFISFVRQRERFLEVLRKKMPQ